MSIMSENKKIIVVQFRTDDTVEQDKECIRESFAGTGAELEFINGVTEGFPEHPEEAAGVVLSGSSEFYVGRGKDTDAWLKPAGEFIDKLDRMNIPTFGLCYGSQMLGVHYGGRIVEDKDLEEVGTLEITLLDAAKDDPVFSALPEKFVSVIGHKETVIDLPENQIPLARSEKVNPHAVRIAGKPIWASLFHPEINKKQLIDRLLSHMEYVDDPDNFEKISEQYEEIPHAAEVLRSFARFAFSYERPTN